MLKKALFLLILLMVLPSLAGAIEVYREGDVSLNIGYWAQAWYQYVRDIDRDVDGKWDDSLNDFMIRRTYFSVSGTVTPKVSVFMHYAGDRIGQEGLDTPGMGLGTGLALRDGWVNYKVLKDDLMVQVGRMYVPFTRNYGTTSTMSMLTTDLDWGQGGLRSGILYPQKVGRDDSVTLWGNVVEDKLQYRLMVGEGVEGSAANPDDTLRFAGRLSFNLFDPETGWFNAGTYLGKKKILAFGGGFDFQPDLVTGGAKHNYGAYTTDMHLDLPAGPCAITAEVAWLMLRNVANPVTWSALAAGTDGDIYTAKLGVLLPGDFQPFTHFELIHPDASGADNTMVSGVGCNYYIKGPANKLTAEWSVVDDDTHTVDIITVQAAFGF
ncbi:MAG: hypothetical protein COX19_07470 [Desulfobacterales bacterium CG23_combo_of_CG06-09_8_20_14_all_51_8]|nr:MAG: hypothetical protein COX19_07470 [Desulfobacterales bacterium CG23_combo_of_CG06-09_8_20_14_all_51_8]